MRIFVLFMILCVSKANAATKGLASWYYYPPGKRYMANGKMYNPNRLTCASKTLPFGTRLLVTSLRTGKSVVVTVTDRGPYTGNRLIDLSKQAAKLLGIVSFGVSRVQISVVR